MLLFYRTVLPVLSFAYIFHFIATGEIAETVAKWWFLILRSILSQTTLKEMIYTILASCKAASASYCMASIGVAGLIPCLIVFLFFSSSVYAFRIACPPFDRASSFLSLARDSSLVAPYDVQEDPSDNKENYNDGKLSLDSGSDAAADIVHFCFLVHGFQGRSGDLSYFETVLKHRACVERSHQQSNRHGQDQYETDDDFVIVPTVTDSKDSKEIDTSTTQDMVVHNVVCNEGKTNDGVVKGGDRLIDEIREVVGSNMKQRYPELESKENESDQKKKSSEKLDNITISIVGNSMGGVYGRYAIAKLIERHCVAEIQPTKKNREREGKEKQISPLSWILDGKYRLRLDTFCTTAAPHLGVSQHTWIRIPRIAEMGIAATMGQSGRDLFRLNNLIYNMSTDSTYLDPLASFRKRIAYANCYGTDFPVPVGTAAFLSEKSTYPHQFLDNCRVEDECGLITATLTTDASTEKLNESKEPFDDELHKMSVSLDRLGWKKVFVDLQKEMISITLPRLAYVSGSDRSNGSNRLADGNDLRDLKKLKTMVSSKDIINVVNKSKSRDYSDTDDSNRFVLRAPFGHNMIVAFSRDRLSTFLNKGGRPLVDALAKDVVHDIFGSSRRDEEQKEESMKKRRLNKP